MRNPLNAKVQVTVLATAPSSHINNSDSKSKHTTLFWRCSNVVDVHTTLYQRRNDVVCDGYWVGRSDV